MTRIQLNYSIAQAISLPHQPLPAEYNQETYNTDPTANKRSNYKVS